jgi:hypothetical protein
VALWLLSRLINNKDLSNNSIQFFIYLRAELYSQWPITESARIHTAIRQHRIKQITGQDRTEGQYLVPLKAFIKNNNNNKYIKVLKNSNEEISGKNCMKLHNN